MLLRHTPSLRDGALVLVGASSMYIFSTLVSSSSTIINQYLPYCYQPAGTLANFTSSVQPSSRLTMTATLDLGILQDLPETSVVTHAPGWTLFRNLYMSNGTLFVVASQTARAQLPEPRMMTSTGLPAFNNPENIASREPTRQDIDFLTPDQARKRWGGLENNERNRIWSVEGNTVGFSSFPSFPFFLLS